MLELRNTQLQLVPIRTRDEAEVAREILELAPRALPRAHGVAAPTRAQIVEQRPQLVEPRSEQRHEPVERILRAISLGHAGGPCGAAGAARALPRSRRRRRRPRRRRPASPAPALRPPPPRPAGGCARRPSLRSSGCPSGARTRARVPSTR